MSSQISVLHVDDDPGFVEVVREFLQREDDLAIEAETDPMCALERIRADPDAFDCVISDYDMPNVDGLELLERVREDDLDLPFILFTGKGSESIAAEAISRGVTDYLQKTTGSEQYNILANRVRNAVARRRAEEDATRTRRFLEKVLERATDIIAVVDSNNEIIFASGSVKEHLGYTPAELIDHGPFDLIHPDDRAMVADQFEQRLTHPDQPTGISYRVRHKDGYYLSCQTRGYNLMDDPDIEGILIYTHTIESNG